MVILILVDHGPNAEQSQGWTSAPMSPQIFMEHKKASIQLRTEADTIV